jgi:hypothetical protein
MKARKWWILGFVLMALVVAGPALAAPVGKVTHLEGKADLTNPAGKIRVLKVGDPVSNGDILRTKNKTKVQITFTDGNTLWLAEKTRMKINRYAEGEKSNSYFDLFRGKSRAVVTRLARGSTFEVHTPTAVCGVRGTTVISLFLNGESSFFLQGGAGYGYNRNNPGNEVGIPAGSGMIVTSGNAEPVVKPTTAADIEQHMQDTSAGTGEGSTGTSDAGTTLDVAVPWSPDVIVTPPPPMLPEETASTITFTTPVLVGGFAGTLDGSYDTLLKTGTVSFIGSGPEGAATTPLDPLDPENPPLTGTLSNGATFTGLLGGVPGSYHGFLNSITNNGGALGLLAGNLDGTFVAGSINASGSLTLTDLGYTAAGAFQSFPDVTVPTFATVDLNDLSYMAPVGTGLGYGYPTTSGGLLGIWGSSSTGGYMGGYYNNPGSLTSWSAYYGYDSYNSYSYGPSDTYMLGVISGTDDLAGHTTITGNDSIQYMDPNYFGLVSVNYRGYYYNCDGSCSYDTAGTGTFKLAPLAFSGPWGSGLEMGSIYYNDSGFFGSGYGSEDYGNVGGFSLPWLGATTMYAMGGYYIEPYSGSYTHYLWNTPIEGYARTGENEWDSNRAFYGYTAGLWLPGAAGVGTLEGAARALFGNLTESTEMSGYYGGTIGILGANNLQGNWYTFHQQSGEGYYEDGMWRASGTLSPYYTETVSDAWSIYQDSSPINGSIYGKFDVSTGDPGYIQGQDNGNSYVDFFMVNNESRPWGIYNLRYESGEGGGFFRPTGATTFTAYTGGQGYFGYYGGSSGYWLASVKGTWNDAGEIRGWLGPISGDNSAFGVWMTEEYLGAIGGPYYGVNIEEGGTSGSWIATSIGTYIGQPLEFKGKMGSYGARDGLYNLTWTSGDYGYLGYYGSTSSYLDGLIGATSAPTLGSSWSGSTPVPVTMLGDFYYTPPFGASGWYEGKLLWNYTTRNGSTVQLMAGEHVGYTAGVADVTTGAMEGASAMLYVDANGNAGILTSFNPASYTTGGVTGNLYPFSPAMSLDVYGMWLAGMDLGGIKFAEDGSFSESGYSNFALRQGAVDNVAGYSSSNIYLWGYGGAETLYFNNPNATGALPGGALPWGVYDLKFTGIGSGGGYYGNYFSIDNISDINNPAGDLSGKSIDIGGKNAAGWYQIGSIYDTVWADNRIDGKIEGRYMSRTQWGEFEGPFYGLYNINTYGDGYGGYYGSGGWTGESVGVYAGIPLYFSADTYIGTGVNAFLDYYDPDGIETGSKGYITSPYGEFSGRLGVTVTPFGEGGSTPYSPTPLKGMGIYNNYGNYPLFLGYFSGNSNTPGEDYSVGLLLGGLQETATSAKGLLGGVYKLYDSASGYYGFGIMYSTDGSGVSTPVGINISAGLPWSYGMWELKSDAQLQAYQMTAPFPNDFLITRSSEMSSALYGPYYAEGLPVGYTLYEDAHYSERVMIENEPWSIGAAVFGGGLTLPEGGTLAGKTWTMETDQPSTAYLGKVYTRVEMTSVDDATGQFTAKVVGASVNWNEGQAWTSVQGAAVKGLFNPGEGTWRAIGVGVGMETTAFMDKVGNMTDNAARQAFQNATSIPSFQVGTINLKSDQSTFNNHLTVDMGTMTFFSSVSGGAASIWATKNVSGTWESGVLPLTGVNLYVGGNTALPVVGTFTPQFWSGGTWGATVQGGPLNLGGVNTSVNFAGGAAGALGVGTFSGTGAGIVK